MQGAGQDQAASKRSGTEAPSKMCPVKNMAFKSGIAGFMALNSFTLKKGNPPRRKRAPFHKIEKAEPQRQNGPSLVATCASEGPLLHPTPWPSINLVRKLTGQWDP